MKVFRPTLKTMLRKISLPLPVIGFLITINSASALTNLPKQPPIVEPPPNEISRCAGEGGELSCSYQEVNFGYTCQHIPFSRKVRWQIPVGTAPEGGWPVSFYFEGTVKHDSNPFQDKTNELPIFQELLDDPANTGTRYAVFAAHPPLSPVYSPPHGGFLRFWNTNVVPNYASSCDYDFLSQLFAAIKNGEFGSSPNFNMERRFAWGHSSGGYNTSRMAVTFNQGTTENHSQGSCNEWCNQDTWKGLAIIAGSYATCGGATCSIPNLPENHPPTKLYHGYGDNIVPHHTGNNYFQRLLNDGVETEFHSHDGGHTEPFMNFGLGNSGIKEWFDRF